ncbi:hypothetical protein [Cupriavidus campinensis]|uniref:Uncharacterized protein n=1 Tax=Cupriavidus campinensis TaxID=151783 RepID=A0ABY3ETJ1_9BURK|nr:hypothetical protein [Cupriavidus campinensis]TSP14022.1 hypothetical protein FGG12_06005 [Cupriavidus campinensis]
MSHFTVLVIGNDIEKQLAPFQENNMGDCPKEYMAFNNVEEEHRPEWETGTFDRIRLVDGKLVEVNDESLYRPATEEEIAIFNGKDRKAQEALAYRRTGWGPDEKYSVFQLPEGAERVQIPRKQEFETFEAYMEDYCGYEKDGEQGAFGYWENPNRKWDWYQVGGRWSGMFKLKEGAAGELGKRSLLDRGEDTRAIERRADQAKKGDVDFAGMRDERGQQAGERWDKVHAIIAGRPIPLWKEILERHGPANIESARTEYYSNPVVQDINKAHDEIGWIDSIADYAGTREEYVQAARDAAGCTFAVLKDGKWYERGSMGWWGVVADETERDDWNRQFAALIDGLPDDTLLSVVDCHI